MSSSLLDRVAAEVRGCQLCLLSRGRTNAVPGEGRPTAEIMFIGEAPGQEEDRYGQPFVGRAGKLLDRALREAGLRRESVFITNMVKCRPPDNRPPTVEEIAACSPYLERQVAGLKPRIFCLLGGSATKAMLGRRTVTRLRGKLLNYKGRKYFVTLHPAAALRNPDFKDILREDLKRLREAVLEPKFVTRKKQTTKLDAFLHQL